MGDPMRRSRRAVVAVALLLVLDLSGSVTLLVATGGRGLGTSDRNATHARPGTQDDAQLAARRDRAKAVRDVLGTRAAAVLHHDLNAFLASVDPGSPDFRSRQVTEFANLQTVPFSSFAYAVDAEHDGPSLPRQKDRYGAPTFVPAVQLLYRLKGFDARPDVVTQVFTFVQRPGGWFIGADDDVPASGSVSQHALWDFGPVISLRGRHCLVLSHPGKRGLLPEVAAEVDHDIPLVTAVWGTHWSRKVVVVLPDSQSELAALIGDAGDLSQIAAVAVAEVGVDAVPGSGVGDRVVVNPPNFAKLGAIGRQVVLTHEITHVATRAATGPTIPTWLVEGFADYVGYLQTSVPVDVAATELRTDIRDGNAPSALPGDSAFDGSNPRLAQAYEQAWMACRLVASLAGTRGLVHLYHLMGDPSAKRAGLLDRSLRAVVHLSAADFTTQWQRYLRRQLS